jgi:Zn-dependent M28 family amino/carboxypeptidase
LLCVACSRQDDASAPPTQAETRVEAKPAPVQPTSEGAFQTAITAEDFAARLQKLSSDQFEGRQPGTIGERMSTAYIKDQFERIGLKPGNKGSWFQTVPMMKVTVLDPTQVALAVNGSKSQLTLGIGADSVIGSLKGSPQVTLKDSPIVFVGYGVSAPGLGYDDYASGIDVKDKVVAFLSGAPAKLPSNERAYFSSGAVKEAEAVKRGAIGTISFTSADDPRFRWDVSTATGAQGSYAWIDGEGKPNRGDAALRASASLNHSGVAAIFAGSKTTAAQVFEAAKASTPQAFDLATHVSITTTSTHTDVESANVIAKLEGSDPALKNEHVVYVAHVDHFGVGVPMKGDTIYNGAHDNASGVAIVLEVARAYAALPTRPRRSILFTFVTAEERGLLGSDYFARHPTVPKDSIVADLTLDMPFLYHKLLDIVPYGAQHSSLSVPVANAAKKLGIGIGTDPIPEQVLFIRSDHFSFVRQGVPSLFIKSGFQTGDPAKDGAAINAGYRRDVYHKPNDDMSQAFDFEAGASHAKVNFLTGWQVAQTTARPSWNTGDFFGTLFGSTAATGTGAK